MNDTIYVCPYCQKSYKTEKGCRKHVETCEKRKNYDMLTEDPDLFVNMNLICGFLYQKKYYNQDNKQLFMANDRIFSKVKKFTEYEQAMEVFGKIDFLTYLFANKISINKWCEEEHLINFLYNWLYYEDESHAVNRSINWLEKHNLTISTISPNRLFLALKYGNISVKYLNAIEYDWEHNIDCDSDELTKLKYFLRG